VETVIKIEKKYLIFREDARKIAQRARKKYAGEKARSFALDFSQVEFMSRSFVDELLNELQAIENSGRKVTLINTNPQLQNFMEGVNKKKQVIKKEMAGVT